LEKAIKQLSSKNDEGMGNGKMKKNIEMIINIVAKYNSISNALKIHGEIFKETSELITRLSSSEHENVLNHLLGPEFRQNALIKKEEK
jgi:hypothetical protein